jgi:hypothetical protein
MGPMRLTGVMGNIEYRLHRLANTPNIKHRERLATTEVGGYGLGRLDRRWRLSHYFCSAARFENDDENEDDYEPTRALTQAVTGSVIWVVWAPAKTWLEPLIWSRLTGWLAWAKMSRES